MDFAYVKTGLETRFDLVFVCVDECGCQKPGVVEDFDGIGDGVDLARDIKPAFGGDFRPAFRDKHDGVGVEFAGDGEHFLGGCHFEIESDLDETTQEFGISVHDVTAVLAQVNGDAVRPTEFRFVGSPDRVGLAKVGLSGIPGLSDRGDMVNVDTELNHA